MDAWSSGEMCGTGAADSAPASAPAVASAGSLGATPGGPHSMLPPPSTPATTPSHVPCLPFPKPHVERRPLRSLVSDAAPLGGTHRGGNTGSHHSAVMLHPIPCSYTMSSSITNGAALPRPIRILRIRMVRWHQAANQGCEVLLGTAWIWGPKWPVLW
jgi:hypothetical protein